MFSCRESMTTSPCLPLVSTFSKVLRNLTQFLILFNNSLILLCDNNSDK